MAANTFPFRKPQRFIVFAPIITYILALLILPSHRNELQKIRVEFQSEKITLFFFSWIIFVIWMLRKNDNCGDSDLLSIIQAFSTDSVTEGDTKSAFITLIWRSQLGLASTIDFTQSILIQTYYRTNFQYYKERFFFDLECSREKPNPLRWTRFFARWAP